MPTETTDLIARVSILPDSAWFSGHFPDHPVLPGIAQLKMVFDLIQQHTAFPLRVAEVSRVRFKRTILPDDRISIVAAPRPGTSDVYSFRLEKADGLVTTGTLKVAPCTITE